MLPHYFILAFRNMGRQKAYATINIGGLSIGMAVAMLIGLWIYDEFSFNHYHQNYSQIAIVMRHFTIEGTIETGGESSPMPLSNELRSAYGDEFTSVVMSTKPVEYSISSSDKVFTQSGRFMEPGAAKLLSLHMLEGSFDGLKEQHSIFLSANLAKKLFGTKSALHKVVTIDTKVDATVTGVYQDLPANCEFSDLTYLAPFDLYVSFNAWTKEESTNWQGNSFPIYAQIAPHTTFEQVSAKIKESMLPHLDGEKLAQKTQVFLHPMRDWHLYSSFENGVQVMSEGLQYIWFYAIIGGFVLILACINFMNLSTAGADKRAKEVGVRKSIGCLRRQLIVQFMSESFVMTLLAFLLCLCLVMLLLPFFNQLSGKQLAILWAHPGFWLGAIVFTLITALLAGMYPAFYLSSLKAVQVLKGAFKPGIWAGVFGQSLVVFQFAISMALIMGTMVIYQQIELAKNRPIGYDTSGLLLFSKNGLQEKAAVLSNELISSGVVAEVGETSSKLSRVGSNNTGFDWPGKVAATEDDFGTISVSGAYGKTIGWQFIKGRDFSKDLASDSMGIVINEAAMKVMALENPVGELVRSSYWQKGDYRILGVVKDMVMESPFEPARPTIFSLRGYKGWILVKIKPGVSMHQALPKIEKIFKQVAPMAAFSYTFVDEEYEQKFAGEKRVGKIAGFFAMLAMVISCIGLFGVASFTAQKRTKEMGIRKVLGASVLNLWSLLSKQFLILITIACMIASPIAFYSLTSWLENYQYRTEISPWIFVLTGGLAFLVTLLTISYHVLKAALTNPVQSLKNE